MLPLLLFFACGPDAPPPVEVAPQTLTVQLDNLSFDDAPAELVCRCATTHSHIQELTDKVSTDMEERQPIPVSAAVEGDTVTLTVGAASMQNPYTGPDHMLHTPTCKAEILLLLRSPDYEGLVLGLTRDLQSPPTPGAAELTRKQALTSTKAHFEASGGWTPHRSQVDIEVLEAIEGELVEVDGRPALRVGDREMTLAYPAPHLLQHLGPLKGTGVLAQDAVFWTDFEVMPYSFKAQQIGAARVDNDATPPRIEVQGEPWATELLNPDAFPEGIWTGKVAYHLVGKHGDLHMQHGVYAYPTR